MEIGIGNMQSEETGLMAEELWLEKYSMVDSKKEGIIDIINECLRLQDESGILALYELYSDEGFVKLFDGDKETAYIYVALKIFRCEVENNEKNTIFAGRCSIDDVVEYIKEIKFHLWRVLFADDLDAAEWLDCNIQNGLITNTCVDCLKEYYCCDR